MSKAKIEIRADIPVIVFSCGGCRPCGHAEYEIIKELETEKAELIEALKDVINSVTFGIQCISIEKLNEIMQKHNTGE